MRARFLCHEAEPRNQGAEALSWFHDIYKIPKACQLSFGDLMFFPCQDALQLAVGIEEAGAQGAFRDVEHLGYLGR